jgi:dCMP deaminase
LIVEFQNFIPITRQRSKKNVVKNKMSNEKIKDMKPQFKEAYLDVARRFAELSHARRLHVGAIVVKDDRIISIGYNGMPAGWDNNCENVEWCSGGGWLGPEEIEEGWPFEGTYTDVDGNVMQGRYRLKTKPEVLHAESNAIAKLAKSNDSGCGADIFITHAPCIECAKLIYQSGINNVYYGENYRDDAGIEFLKKSGVKIEKLDT